MLKIVKISFKVESDTLFHKTPLLNEAINYKYINICVFLKGIDIIN